MHLRFVMGEPVGECSWQRVRNVTLTLTVYGDEEEPSFGDHVIAEARIDNEPVGNRRYCRRGSSELV
jgi:hypothetical protein